LSLEETLPHPIERPKAALYILIKLLIDTYNLIGERSNKVITIHKKIRVVNSYAQSREFVKLEHMFDVI
tara:strand:+ start:369 stop:575 length:207 start_codon:yes stop_codon:yes gene_type:complete